MSGRPIAVAVSGRGLVDPSAPVLPADDEGFARGRAAFETTRIYGGHPFRLAQHLERLVRSAASLGLVPPARGEIEQLVAQAIEASGALRPGADDTVLRVYWTPGPPADDSAGTAVVVVAPVPAWIEDVRARGQSLASVPLPARSLPWMLPGVKATSYAVHLAAEAEAKRRGADDALLVDLDGTVLEGPVTNIWWRVGDALYTPSLQLGILAGETRAALLGAAPRLGFSAFEGRYPLSDLLAADEAFTSSSVREVLGVRAIDDVQIPLGAAARTLQSALRVLARDG